MYLEGHVNSRYVMTVTEKMTFSKYKPEVWKSVVYTQETVAWERGSLSNSLKDVSCETQLVYAVNFNYHF